MKCKDCPRIDYWEGVPFCGLLNGGTINPEQSCISPFRLYNSLVDDLMHLDREILRKQEELSYLIANRNQIRAMKNRIQKKELET